MTKEPIIFIDTEDMEERYAEGLYMDYLKEENQQLKQDYNKVVHEATEFESKVYELQDRINKAIDEIEYNMQYDDNIDDYWVTTNKLLEILKGE